MTDNEIIKVFKYCILNDRLNDCRNCGAYQDDKCTIPDLGQEILQLFDRQKAEIERLKKECENKENAYIDEFCLRKNRKASAENYSKKSKPQNPKQ